MINTTCFAVGAPIACPRVAQPSKEQIADYHARYVSALTELFEAHKTKFNVEPDSHIRIVE